MVVPQRRADPVKHIDGVFDRGICRNCHLNWTTWQEYKALNP
jgi:hypothetical protein